MSFTFDKNKQKELLQNLQDLGLSHKEAQVYLSLILLGEVGSSKIVKDTGLHGQFVYTVLDTLEEKGLIQYVVKRGRKKFSAKSPAVLSILVNSKKIIADRLANELEQLIAVPQEQHIEIFQGIESYKAQEFHILELLPDNSEIMIFGGSKDQFTRILGLEFNTYERIRNKKGITIRYIGSQDQKHELNVMSQAREHFGYKVLPGAFSGLVTTTITDKHVLFTVYGNPVTTTVVTNSYIAESHKQQFETMWNMGI